MNRLHASMWAHVLIESRFQINGMVYVIIIRDERAYKQDEAACA